MTDEQSDDQVPEPQGYLGVFPYDWRRPTRARVRARWWNPNDPRVFTPKSFGVGWDVNWYWVVHPGEAVRSRRSA
jgi:Family of unknown function (DUF5808)